MSKLISLSSAKDFEFRRFKKSASSQNLRFKAVSTTYNSPRFGFVISKKILNKASDRNKLKRRLRAIAQGTISNLTAADILVFPQTSALKKPFNDLKIEFVQDLKRLNLWKS